MKPYLCCVETTFALASISGIGSAAGAFAALLVAASKCCACFSATLKDDDPAKNSGLQLDVGICKSLQDMGARFC